MQDYYMNKLEVNTNFTAEKLNNFETNIGVLKGNIFKDKKLEIK
jgi:hypothetical protein